jgi:hypothetical protein
MARSRAVKPVDSLELLYRIAHDVLATFWTGLFPGADRLTLQRFLDRACRRTKLCQHSIIFLLVGKVRGDFPHTAVQRIN